VPLIIRDAIFGTDGSLIYDDNDESSLMGDVILVNGVPWPRMQVERRKYRFRVLNASLGRSYRLALSTKGPMTVIATDGGLMPAPQKVADMRLGMAERYEIVIDFAEYKVGQRIVLRNLGLKNNVSYPSTANIMAFDVVGEATDTSNNEVPLIAVPAPRDGADRRAGRHAAPARAQASARPLDGQRAHVGGRGPERVQEAVRQGPGGRRGRCGSSSTAPAAGSTPCTST
jgi:hypothetical protein